MELITPRLILRDYAKDDLPQVWETLREKELAKQVGRIPHPCTKEYAAGFLERIRRGAEEGWSRELAVTDRETGAYLGNCGYAELYPRHRRGELIYFLRESVRGRGYGREAAEAVRSWAVEQLRLQRLSARCFADNTASRRLLESLGFELEGIARREIFREDGFQDVCCYAWLTGAAE